MDFPGSFTIEAPALNRTKWEEGELRRNRRDSAVTGGTSIVPIRVKIYRGLHETTPWYIVKNT